MQDKNLFQKYNLRLAKEGLLKSLLFSFVIGVIVALIPIVFSFFVVHTIRVSVGLWISLGVLLVVIVIATPLLYFLFFRPNTKQIISRIDRLGLDERLITMTELKNDTSYIAMLQREDAKEKLLGFKKESLKLTISLMSVIAVVIASVVMASMVTVSALGVRDRQDWFGAGGTELPPPVLGEFIEVSYFAGRGGFVYGDTHQLIMLGQNSSMVVAVADDGWVFVEWSDGATSAARLDINIRHEIEVVAIFEQEQEGAEEVPSDEEDGDEPNVPPPHFDGNSVIDGQTHFRDVRDMFYAIAMQMLAEGREVPEHLREILQIYFGMVV